VGLTHRRALVVGTDPGMLSDLRAALQPLCAVRVAASQAQARQELAVHPPHVLIVDAGTDAAAVEVVGDFRQTSVAPAIVLAETGQEDLAVRALQLRANAYLRKPIKRDRIRAEVAAVLAEGPRPEHVAEHAQSVMRRMADKAPSLEEVSAQLGLRPRRLRRLFIERFGRTPTEYVRELRIQEAQRLLVTTDLPVHAIGARLGFPSAPHFDRTFKLLVGATPLQFRFEHRVAPAAFPRLPDAGPAPVRV